MSVDQAILELIEAHAVPDQAELRRLLESRGHRLTQPTLSRHLKKLSVMKVDGRYQHIERSAGERPPYRMVDAPPNLLILTTAPGHAQLLGVVIDRSGIPEVAGTLAGDDTVFIALAPGAGLHEAKRRIEAALEA